MTAKPPASPKQVAGSDTSRSCQGMLIIQDDGGAKKFYTIDRAWCGLELNLAIVENIPMTVSCGAAPKLTAVKKGSKLPTECEASTVWSNYDASKDAAPNSWDAAPGAAGDEDKAKIQAWMGAKQACDALSLGTPVGKTAASKGFNCFQKAINAIGKGVADGPYVKNAKVAANPAHSVEVASSRGESPLTYDLAAMGIVFTSAVLVYGMWSCRRKNLEDYAKLLDGEDEI